MDADVDKWFNGSPPFAAQQQHCRAHGEANRAAVQLPVAGQSPDPAEPCGTVRLPVEAGERIDVEASDPIDVEAWTRTIQPRHRRANAGMPKRLRYAPGAIPVVRLNKRRKKAASS